MNTGEGLLLDTLVHCARAAEHHLQARQPRVSEGPLNALCWPGKYCQSCQRCRQCCAADGAMSRALRELQVASIAPA